MGAVSCLPFKFATAKVRGVNPTQSSSLAGLFAAAIAGSFAILASGLVICGIVARDVLIAFAIAEILTFILVVIAFGIVSRKR